MARVSDYRFPGPVGLLLHVLEQNAEFVSTHTSQNAGSKKLGLACTIAQPACIIGTPTTMCTAEITNHKDSVGAAQLPLPATDAL